MNAISELRKSEIRRKPNFHQFGYHSLSTQNGTKKFTTRPPPQQTTPKPSISNPIHTKGALTGRNHLESHSETKKNTPKLRNCTFCSNNRLNCISRDICSSRLPIWFHRSRLKPYAVESLGFTSAIAVTVAVHGIEGRGRACTVAAKPMPVRIASVSLSSITVKLIYIKNIFKIFIFRI